MTTREEEERAIQNLELTLIAMCRKWPSAKEGKLAIRRALRHYPSYPLISRLVAHERDAREGRHCDHKNALQFPLHHLMACPNCKQVYTPPPP
jgi:hypothetical protein